MSDTLVLLLYFLARYRRALLLQGRRTADASCARRDREQLDEPSTRFAGWPVWAEWLDPEARRVLGIEAADCREEARADGG